jgi:hypothetical protein
MGGLEVVPEVLVERREPLPERERQPAVEVVAGRDAVGDQRGLREEDVAGELVDHVLPA